MSHYGPSGGPGIQIGGTGPIPQIPSAIPVSVPGGGIPLMTLHPGVGTGVPSGQHFVHIGGNSGGFHPPSSSSLTLSNHHHYYNPIQQPGHATTSQKILVDGLSSSSLSSSNSSAAITTGSRVIPSNQQEMVIETIDDGVEVSFLDSNGMPIV